MGKFIKFTLALIVCSSLSLFAWALAVGLSLSKSGFGVAPDKPSTLLDSLGLVLLFLFPFVLFPLIAWLLRTQFELYLRIFFGLVPFALVFLVIGYFRISDAAMRRQYLIDNPPTGQRVKYAPDGNITQIISTKDNKLDGVNIEVCQDGSIRRYGVFEFGRGVDVHVYREMCNDSLITVTQFGREGDIIDEKKLNNGKLTEHTFRDASYSEGIKDITLEYKQSEINRDWFIRSRTSKIRKDLNPSTPVRTERQSFNENGRLISEGAYSYGGENFEREFDKDGALISEITQVGGNRTVKLFDRKGHLTQECQFDIMNRIVSIKDPNSKCTTN